MKLDVSHVEFRDRTPRDGEWPVRTDKAALTLDLAKDAEAQWERLGTKVRAQIKRPGREGASVAVGGCELLKDYYDVFSRNMRDLGTPVYARSFFERILAELRGHADVLIVYLHGRPTAAGLLLHHGASTEIPWASSLREFNKFGVNMLLYWECLKRAIEKGAKTFDFGRSTVDSGPYRFKLQWGATPVQLYWHYWLRAGGALPRLNPANPKYALAINVWRRMPLFLTNAVGPYVVRHLP
jgi:FemAB-related protein (PEP-CTERM system-associated)